MKISERCRKKNLATPPAGELLRPALNTIRTLALPLVMVLAALFRERAPGTQFPPELGLLT